MVPSPWKLAMTEQTPINERLTLHIITILWYSKDEKAVGL